MLNVLGIDEPNACSLVHRYKNRKSYQPAYYISVILSSSINMWIKCFVFFVFVVLGVVAQSSSIDEFSGVISALRIAGRLYDDCSKKDSFLTCFKMKAVTMLDRAGRSDEIALTDYLTLVRYGNSDYRVDSGRALTENDLESILPGGNSEARENKLTNMLIDKLARFFNTHTVKFSLPNLSSGELQRGVEEG